MKSLKMMSLGVLLLSGAAFGRQLEPLELSVGTRQKVVMPLPIVSVRSNRPSVLKVRQLGTYRIGIEGRRPGKVTLVMKTLAGNRAEVDVDVLPPYAPSFASLR